MHDEIDRNHSQFVVDGDDLWPVVRIESSSSSSSSWLAYTNKQSINEKKNVDDGHNHDDHHHPLSSNTITNAKNFFSFFSSFFVFEWNEWIVIETSLEVFFFLFFVPSNSNHAKPLKRPPPPLNKTDIDWLIHNLIYLDRFLVGGGGGTISDFVMMMMMKNRNGQREIINKYWLNVSIIFFFLSLYFAYLKMYLIYL